MTEQTDASHDSVAKNEEGSISTEFDLSRVFSLLSIIIGLLALGFISSLYISVDNRLENIEKSYPVTIKSLDNKIDLLDETLSAKVFESMTPVAGAKQLLVGSELSRTLFLMRYVAGDPAFTEEVRKRAAQLHAHVDAMIKDLQAGR